MNAKTKSLIANLKHYECLLKKKEELIKKIATKCEFLNQLSLEERKDCRYSESLIADRVKVMIAESLIRRY